MSFKVSLIIRVGIGKHVKRSVTALLVIKMATDEKRKLGKEGGSRRMLSTFGKSEISYGTCHGC